MSDSAEGLRGQDFSLQGLSIKERETVNPEAGFTQMSLVLKSRKHRLTL